MSYFKDNWDAELQNEVLESVEVIVHFFWFCSFMLPCYIYLPSSRNDTMRSMGTLSCLEQQRGSNPLTIRAKI